MFIKMLKQLKVSLLTLLAAAFLFSCNNSQTAAQQEAAQSLTTPVQPADPNAAAQPAAQEAAVPTGPTTVMSFAETEFDFGTVVEGEKVSHTYKFKNDGQEPLILSNAKGSCGCTVPEWPKEPIAPGASNIIKVRYATNRIGAFSKTVTLTTNEADGQHVLRIKGEVLQPAQPASESGSDDHR